MKKDTVQNRLNSMERQVNGSLTKVDEAWRLMDERITRLREEYDARMKATADYYGLPWYRRLITRRPR